MKYHPPALKFLFLTEMWERFGYYVVQGLFVLYLTQFYGFSDNESYSIQGAFTALVCMSPFIGGILADRLLGAKNAIIWGGFFLIVGYALLAISSAKLFFYLGIATIIVGNGLFKPNISTLLGTQYEDHDSRRDTGFTIFYVGINIGAGIAGLTAGYIREYIGWNASFAAACVGLIIGITTFFYGLPSIKTTTAASLNLVNKLKLFFCCLITIISIYYLLKTNAITNWLLPTLGTVLFIYLTTLVLKQKKIHQKNMSILVLLVFSSIVYWMIDLQMFFSINLYADRLANKNILGFHLSTTIFFASACIFILILGPIFAWIWQTLGRKNINPSPIYKFIAGFILTGLSCIVLGASTLFPDNQMLINPLWIFLCYFLMMMGDLLISPIGLSAVTTLAPSHLTGLMMGAWFAAIGLGGFFGGMIAKLASIPETMQNNADKLIIYQHAFYYFAYIAFITAAILFIIQSAIIVISRTKKISLEEFEDGISITPINP